MLTRIIQKSNKFSPRISARFNSHGNEPSGLFLGLKENRKLFEWEKVWIVGFYGSFLTFFALEYFSPRTKPTERAAKEAESRLNAKGESNTMWPFPAK